MPVHSIVEAADCPAAEQLLLTIGRAGVLSSRAIAAKDLDALLSLLGLPAGRKRSDLKRATDIVLVEDGHLIYWPRSGRRRRLCDRPLGRAEWLHPRSGGLCSPCAIGASPETAWRS